MAAKKQLTVYTYFDYRNAKTYRDEVHLLLRWEEAWTKAGYSPVVLKPVNAQIAHDYEAWKMALVMKYGPDADFYQFERWKAIASTVRLSDRALFVDYNVFNFGKWVQPEAWPQGLTSMHATNEDAVCATGTVFNQIAKELVNRAPAQGAELSAVIHKMFAGGQGVSVLCAMSIYPDTTGQLIRFDRDGNVPAYQLVDQYQKGNQQ